MPFVKRMKGLPQDLFVAEGLMYQDWYALTPCQRECTNRLGVTIQREQEAYLTRHPEILAMLKIFIAKMTLRAKRKDFEKETAEHFSRSFAELDEEIRYFLESPPDGPYVDMRGRQYYEPDDEDFQSDIRKIIMKNYPLLPWDTRSPPDSPPNTLSSSFISIQTSEITLPTPEPIPTPEPTTSEILYNMVSNAVDKGIYFKVDEYALLYDTAYVELMRVVEEAMEIPVIDIRVDIATLLHKAYRLFELNVAAKDEIAAAVAWEKRMRKKLKRSLRRQKNFKGYETPPTPKSEISSHESYKRPPPRPCKCQEMVSYNRYGKDRFGIYLPRAEKFRRGNITTTPACSSETNEGLADDKPDAKSVHSKKSGATSGSASYSVYSSRANIKQSRDSTEEDESS